MYTGHNATDTYDAGLNPWIFQKLEEYTNEKEDVKVIDVGCWKWNLWKSFMKKYPNVEFFGIEYYADSMYAKNAWYKEVFSISLDNYEELEKIPNESYDIMILGDVLEHTLFPDKTFKILQKKLKKDGVFLVSLPNIGFALYRLKLLFGRWDYAPDGVGGVMDNTHFRFFTLHSMRKFFEWLNLEIVEEFGLSVVQDKFAFLRFLWKLLPSVFALQIEFVLKNK